MISDVLVFTPVYRLEPETVAAIMELEWDGPLSILLQRDNPHREPVFVDGAIPQQVGATAGVKNHLHQYQRGRAHFLQGSYEAMLVIESDVVPPPDTLKRLAAVDADIAYGVYTFRNSGRVIVNIFEKYADKNGRRARNIGESWSVRGLWPQLRDSGVQACSEAGLGCVLIKRHVIEAIPFRLDGENGRSAHCDSFFTADAWAAGYEMKAETGVICGHKDVDGTVLWPD